MCWIASTWNIAAKPFRTNNVSIQRWIFSRKSLKCRNSSRASNLCLLSRSDHTARLQAVSDTRPEAARTQQLDLAWTWLCQNLHGQCLPWQDSDQVQERWAPSRTRGCGRGRGRGGEKGQGGERHNFGHDGDEYGFLCCTLKRPPTEPDRDSPYDSERQTAHAADFLMAFVARETLRTMLLLADPHLRRLPSSWQLLQAAARFYTSWFSSHRPIQMWTRDQHVCAMLRPPCRGAAGGKVVTPHVRSPTKATHGDGDITKLLTCVTKNMQNLLWWAGSCQASCLLGPAQHVLTCHLQSQSRHQTGNPCCMECVWACHGPTVATGVRAWHQTPRCQPIIGCPNLGQTDVVSLMLQPNQS